MKQSINSKTKANGIQAALAVQVQARAAPCRLMMRVNTKNQHQAMAKIKQQIFQAGREGKDLILGKMVKLTQVA